MQKNILINSTEQSFLTVLFYKTFFLLIFLLSFNLESFGQKSIKLVSSNSKTLISIKEGTRTKVKYHKNEDNFKVKGKLIILNDSLIMLDSNIIHKDSIYKIGKIPFIKQYLGHGAAVQGVGLTGLGTYFMYKFFTFDQNPGQGKVFTAILYAMAGTTLITSGPPLTIAGEYIAHGSMRKTKKNNRKLIVQ
jgi:hypothetical protein